MQIKSPEVWQSTRTDKYAVQITNPWHTALFQYLIEHKYVKDGSSMIMLSW